MYCTKCGKELPEGVVSCPECGEKVKKDIDFQDVKAYARQKAQQAASVIQDKAQQVSSNVQGRYQEFKENREKAAENRQNAASFAQMQQAATPMDAPVNMPQGGYANMQAMYPNMPVQIPAEYKPISAWGYVGYSLLFTIPLVGFILLVVFAVGGTQNKNLTNYARSFFIGLLIAVVILILFGAAVENALSNVLNNLF